MVRFLNTSLILVVFCCARVNDTSKPETWLNLAFYDVLVRDLELYDAEAIESRNRTKQVSWTSYKRYYRSLLENCHTPACASDIFTRFAEGFVNLHSEFKIHDYTDPRIKFDSSYSATPKIVVEYPGLLAYETASLKQITHLNSTAWKDVINHFINYECRFNSASGCVRDFAKRLNANWIKIDDMPLHTITYADGSTSTVTFSLTKRPARGDVKEQFTFSHTDWKTISEGNKYILMQKGNNLLLKYFDFNYPELGGDIYCTDMAPENTLCYDVQSLTKAIIKAGPIEALAIDLQNNFGGAEVTPLVAALAKRPFYDLRIRFKKTPALENDTIRSSLFWFNPRLETWFSGIRQNGTYAATPYGELLPISADFCRGAPDCTLQPIRPSGKLAIERIILVTNYFCLSSCDDFVWRMRDYAKALVAGQPPAADATFSRVTLAYYAENGHIVKKDFGPGQTINPKNLFFTATIPSAATVDESGNSIGHTMPVYEVPVVKEHSHDQETYTLSQVLKHFGL